MVDKPPPPQAPPPPYVPPPEVTPPPTAEAPAITTQAEPPREPVKIEPPPAPAPVQAAAPAPIAIGAVCVSYKETLQSALAGVFDKVGIAGTVTVRIRIKGSQIVEVTATSGPREYYRPLVNAVKRMSCSYTGGDEVTVILPVEFKEGS